MNTMQLLFVSWAVVVIVAIIVFGRWQNRYSLNSRKAHKQHQTNYQRLQSRLATGSGVIQKGAN